MLSYFLTFHLSTDFLLILLISVTYSLSMAISFEKDEKGSCIQLPLPFCKVYYFNTLLWTFSLVTMFGGIVQIGKQSWSICGSTLHCSVQTFCNIVQILQTKSALISKRYCGKGQIFNWALELDPFPKVVYFTSIRKLPSQK